MLLGVNFIMFYRSPNVSWTGDTREVPAEPCLVEACSGGPMAAGCMLVPVHAHWRGPGAPASCGWQLFPGSPVKGLNAKAAWEGSTKSRLRSNKCGVWERGRGRAPVEARDSVLLVCCRGAPVLAPPSPRGFRLSLVLIWGERLVSPVRVCPRPACRPFLQ